MDFLITDTLFLNSAVQDYERVPSSVLLCTSKEAEPPRYALGKHQQDRCLWKFLRQISPCNYVGIHLLSKEVLSQWERLPNLCLIMYNNIYKTVFLAKRQAPLSPSYLHRKEFHLVRY